MNRIAVAKMHGAGNDFMVIDARERALDRPADFARTYCNRHFGVGADGVLLIERDGGRPRMRIVNADGTEAEMCGNGIRCVAAFLDRRGEGVEGIQTIAGPVRVDILERGEVYRVRVGMPVRAHEPFAMDGRSGAFVDMCNPHVVLAGSIDEDVAVLARGVNALERFPHGTNVHVVERRGESDIAVVHHERGAGLTQACGSGAVASAVAAMAFDGAPARLNVFVPGGDLVVEWDGGPTAYLTGPAVHVFDTEVAW